MGAVSDRAGFLETGVHQRGPARASARWRLASGWLEGLGVALSPLVAAVVLRLRLMAPSALPDPAMHTIYIVDPRDVFTRYAAVYASTARLREGARVGFLVPARLAYQAFGAVPGFLVTRYVLALVAAGPVYLLLRRVYGRPAGVAGLVVVLSCPVIVTAWGTDYPDGAVVSYAAGALGCLAMPCAARWRRGWLAGGGALLVLAVWSHGVAVPLAGATLAGYGGVRLVRDRAGLAGDLAVLAAVAVAVTGGLAVASAVLIGHADFIGLTWQAFRFLSQPSQLALWHSASWRWAPYVAYLLVPPAVLGAFAVAIARRRRPVPSPGPGPGTARVPSPVLVVGVVAAAQFALYAWLQFASTVQTLEQHYFSSTLWAGVSLTLAITIAELARPLAGRPLARWLPAVVLLAVPLGYEAALGQQAGLRVPAFGWAPAGVLLAAAVIIAAAAARSCARIGRPAAAATATGLALAALVAAILVLTVAPIPQHPLPPGTVSDPAPAYPFALGGDGTTYINSYRIATALPGFVGPAAYPGEQIFTWRPTISPGRYVEYAGMYHDGFNSLHNHSPDLTVRDRKELRARRPAELLLIGSSAASFPTVLRELAAFRPTLARAGALRAGNQVLHVWIIRLGNYYHPPAHASSSAARPMPGQ